MTLPWKIWTRSLLPSTTLTCTFTSSPGPKSGMSVRRYWLSTRSVDFMARSSLASCPDCRAEAERSRIGERRGTLPTAAGHLRRAHRGLRSGRGGSAACGAGPGPGASARSGRGRRCAAPRAPPSRGTSAGRVYCGSSSRPAAPKLSVTGLVALPIAPGQQAGDGLDHQAGGDLAPAEHDVADAQLAVDEVLADAVVDALVAPAQQAEPVAARPARRPSAGRSGARPGRAGTAAAADRRPRPRRRSARAASPCRRRRRTGRRRRCGGRRWCARAGRAVRRSSSPVGRALPSRLSDAERVDQPREDGEHVDPHGRASLRERDLPHRRRRDAGPAVAAGGLHTGRPAASTLADEGFIHLQHRRAVAGVVERLLRRRRPTCVLLHVDETLPDRRRCVYEQLRRRPSRSPTSTAP